MRTYHDTWKDLVYGELELFLGLFIYGKRENPYFIGFVFNQWSTYRLRFTFGSIKETNED